MLQATLLRRSAPPGGADADGHAHDVVRGRGYQGINPRESGADPHLPRGGAKYGVKSRSRPEFGAVPEKWTLRAGEITGLTQLIIVRTHLAGKRAGWQQLRSSRFRKR